MQCEWKCSWKCLRTIGRISGANTFDILGDLGKFCRYFGEIFLYLVEMPLKCWVMVDITIQEKQCGSLVTLRPCTIAYNSKISQEAGCFCPFMNADIL